MVTDIKPSICMFIAPIFSYANEILFFGWGKYCKIKSGKYCFTPF